MDLPFCFSERCGHFGHQLSRARPLGSHAISRPHTKSNGPGERRKDVAALLPVVHLGDHRHDSQGSEHRELLALSGLRRGLDACSTAHSDVLAMARVIETAHNDTEHNRVAGKLVVSTGR